MLHRRPITNAACLSGLLLVCGHLASGHRAQPARTETAATSLPTHLGTAALRSRLAVARVATKNPRAQFAQLPVAFEPNRGQTNSRVKYLARGRGYSLFLTPAESVLVLRQGGEKAGEKRGSAVLRMSLEGARRRPELGGREPLPGKSNYLLGSDRKKWRTGIPHFRQVKYQGVYPGVDLLYYGQQGELEYDFVVAPGTDPQVIRVVVQGTNRMEVDAAGDLLLQTGVGLVRWRKPVVYQDVGGKRRAVEGVYRLHGKNGFGFRIGAYDRGRPLVIDPVLAFSTYLGGTGPETNIGVAVDSAGDSYVAGTTLSADFPVLNGDFTCGNDGGCDGGLSDVFVARLDPTGSVLVYSTYLGGGGTDQTGPFGSVAVGTVAGTVYVAGATDSTDFPVTGGAFQTSNGGGFDAFITRLDADGSGIVFSTYLGGSADDHANAIAVSAASGEVFVTGKTRSVNFDVTAGALQTSASPEGDAFVTRMNTTGSALIYSTALGGNGMDEAFAIALSGDTAHITGSTGSINFPTSNAVQPVTSGGGVQKTLNSGGLWSDASTGLSQHEVYALAMDPAQPLRLYAGTSSGVFKSTNAAASWTVGGIALANVAVRALAVASDSLTIYAGTDAGMFVSLNAASTWTAINSGVGDLRIRAVHVDPLNPLIAYALTRTSFLRTTNGGASWTTLGAGLGANEFFSFSAASDQSTFLVGTDVGVFSSADQGQNWFDVTGGLFTYNPQGVAARAVAVDPTDSNVLIVGLDTGEVYRSDSGGVAWIPIWQGIRAASIRTIVFDPTNTARVFVGDSKAGIFFSGNGGGIWSPVNGGFLTRTVNALLVDPAAPATLYAGTQLKDAFVAAILPGGGALAFSTYLGGQGPESGRAIAVAPSGILVGGVTSTDNLPMVGSPLQPLFGGGLEDGFAVQLNATGSPLLHSTFLGGSDEDAINGVAVDSNGSFWLVGRTNSVNFPLLDPLQAAPGSGGGCAARVVSLPQRRECPDAFVTGIDFDLAALQFSTYVGAELTDEATSVAIGPGDVAYVAGITSSGSFRVRGGYQSFFLGPPDAFLLAIGPSGNTADLSINLSHTPEPVVIGQPITVTAVITNNGPNTADNVVLHLAAPTNMTASITNTTSTHGFCSFSGTTSCDIGPLLAAEQATITLTLLPGQTGAEQLTMAVGSELSDLAPANNTDSTTFTVIPPLAPCSINFDGGAAVPNQWTDPLNWDTNTLPLPIDNVCIGPGFTVVKSGPGGDQVYSLTVSNGAGVFTLSGGTLNLATTSNIGTDGFTQSGGLLSGDGVLTIQGPFLWTGGAQESTSSSISTVADGGATINAASSVILRARTLHFAGPSQWLAGTIEHGQGATFFNTEPLDVQSNGGFSFTQGGVQSSFSNGVNGVLTKSTAGTATLDVDFFNFGAVQANAGTLAFAGSYFQGNFGSVTRFAGGGISTTFGLNISEGVVEGVNPAAGNAVTGAVILFGGAIRPGGSGAAGTLTIDGNVTLSSGTLSMELGGTGAGQFDHLQVTGLVQLAGTLSVGSFGGFLPLAGQTFQIMTFGSQAGDFTTKNNLTGSATAMLTTLGTTDYVVSFAAPPCSVNAVATGNWNAPATWDTAAVPAGTDNVCIGGNHAVTFNGGTFSANTLSVTSSAPFTVSGGTLTLASGSIGAGGLVQSAGVFTITSALTVGGSFTWSGGTQNGVGTLIVSGQTTFTGSVVLQNRVLNLNGGAVLAATGGIQHGQGSIINLPAGQSFDIQGDADFAYTQGGTPGRFNNLGTFSKLAGAGLTTLDMTFTHGSGASFNVTSGTVRFQNAPSTFDGPFSVTAPGGLEFINVNFTFTSTSGFSGTGTVTFNGAIIFLPGAITSSAAVTLAAGNISGSGTFNCNAPFTWSGGNQTGGGISNFAQQVNITGSVILQTRTLNLNGGAVLSSTGGLQHGLGGIINVPAGQIFDIAGDGDFAFTQGGMRGAFNNLGTLVKSAAGGLSTFDMTITHGPAANLNVTSGTLRFQNASSTFDGPFTITAPGEVDFINVTYTFNLTSGFSGTGTVNFNGANVVVPGALTAATTVNLSGGMISGPGTFQFNGPFTWSGGVQAGGGISNFAQQVALTGSTILQNRTLNLNGGAVLTASGGVQHGQGSIINLPAGQIFDIQGDADFAYTQGGVRGLFNNSGIFRKSGGTGLTSVDITLTHAPAASIEVSTGTMRFQNGPSTFDGPFTVNTPGVLDFINATYTFNSTSGFTGNGTVNFNGAGVLVPGPLAATPTVVLSAGSVDGSGTFDFNGAFTWSGGVQTGGGISNFAQQVALTGSTILQNRTLNLNGGAVLTASGGVQHGQGSIINLPAGQIFDIQGDADFAYTQGGVRGLFNNSGIFRKSGGTGLTSVDITLTHAPAASIEVSTGTMRFQNGPSTFSGPFTATSPGTIEFLNTTYTFNSTSGFGGTGTINFSGADIVVPATLTSTAAVNFSGGSLAGAGTMNFNGPLTWSGGIQAGGGITNVATQLSITGSAVLQSRTLNLNGGAVLSATGGIQHGLGAVIALPAGQTFDIQGDADTVFNQGGQRGVFSSLGTLVKSIGAGTSVFDLQINNGGLVLVSSGTLQTNIFTQPVGGSVTRISGGSISSSVTMSFGAGILEGVDPAAGNAINADVSVTGATIRPGLSPGTMTINGNLTMTPVSVLQVELAGTGAGQFDILNVTGTATFDGTMNVIGFGGFIPAGGNSFQVMTFGTRVGDFATKNNSTGSAASMSTTPGAANYVLSFSGGGGGCTVNAVASGDWGTTSTWDTAVVPLPADDVCVGGAFAVTVSSGTRTVNTLTVTSTAPFTLSGGTLSVAGSSTIGAGGINHSGGTFTGGGTMTVAGPYNWANATMDGTGATIASGGLNISGTVTLTQRTLTTLGSSTWTAGNINAGQGSIWNIPAGASLAISATANLLFNQGGGTPQIQNLGTITKAGAGNVTIGAAVFNNNSLQITTGFLELVNGGASSGAFDVAGTLQFGGGSHLISGTIVGNGTISVSGGTTTFTGPINFPGTLDVQGGTANFNGNATVGAFTQTGGTLGGTAALNIAGPYTWNGGTQDDTGATNANGGITITGGVTLTRRTLASNGGSWTAGNVNHGIGATWNMSGAFDISATGTMIFNQGGSNTQINNLGNLAKSGGSTATINALMNNAGSIVVNGGVLALGGGGISTGNFDAAAATTLQFGGLHTLNTGSLSGAGTVAITSGIASVNGVYNVTGTISVSGGTINFNSAGSVATVTHTNGTVAGTGTLTVTGVYAWGGGTMDGTGTTQTAGLNISSPGGVTLVQRTLALSGAGTWSGGNINVGQSAQWNLGASATLAITASSTITFNQGGANLNINNAGSITRSGSGTSFINALVNNIGIVSVTGGTLALNGGGTSTGSFDAAATLRFGGGVHVLNAGSTLTGAGTVEFTAGTVALNNTYNVTGTITIAGGFPDFNGSGQAATLNLNSGALGGTGSITISGLMTWDGGTLTGTGSTLAAGGLSLTGSSNVTFTQRTLTMDGASQWLNGNINTGAGALWNIVPTGTFNISSNSLLIFNQGGANLIINNQGTITKSGAGTMTIQSQVNNSGTINANGGVLNLAGGGTSTGAFVVPGTLEFGAGNHALTGGSVSGTGTVGFTGSTTTVTNSYTVSGTTSVTGGTVNFDSVASSVLVNHNGGTLSGTGTLNVSGLYTWTAGVMAGTGSTFANGGITLSGAGVTLVQRQLSTGGASTWSSGNINVGMGASWVLQSTGSLALTGTDTIVFNQGGGNLQFTNQGNITKSGVGTVSTINSLFDNVGSVSVAAGSLILGAGGTSSGSFTALAGATLELRGAHNLQAASAVSGAGDVQFTGGGPVNIAGTFNVTGTTTVAGGTANFNATATTASLTLVGGTLGGTGALTATGPFVWSGGTQTGSGTTTAAGGVTIAGGVIQTFRTLNLGGVSAWNAGTVSVGQGAVWNVQAGATLNIPTSASLAFNQGGANLQFNNSGTIAAAPPALLTIGAPFSNQGLFIVSSGQVNFTAGFTQSGGASVTRLAGGTLGGGGTFTINGGLLEGAGGISGTVVNGGGTVRPGLAGSIGAINITGAFTQNAGGTFAVRLGGTAGGQFDALTATGAAALGGTLSVSSFSGFVPGPANVFQIMTFGSRSGDFVTKNNLTGSAATMGTTPATTTYTLDFGPATCNVNSAASGDWSSPATWSPAAVPTSASDVCINANHAVTVSTGSQAANTLTVTSTAAFTLSGGSLALTAGTTFGAGGFSHTGGTLTGGGSVVIAGPYTWSGGVQEGGGITNANVPLTISSTVVLRNRTLNLNAGATATATLSHGLGAVINLPVGQTYSVQGDFVVFNYSQGGAVGQFNNLGSFTRATGSGTASMDMVFTNAGTLNVNTGTLRVDTTLTSSGPVNVTGTLDLNAGTHNFNAGTTLSGTGTVILRATENFNAGASFTLPSVQLVSGVTTLATGSTIVFPNFTHAAGTLTGTDQVDVTSSYVWSGGLQEGGGITNANVPLTISSTVVLRNRTLNLNAGATATATLSHGLGAVINLPVGQTYSVQGDFVVFSYGQGGAAGQFNNLGSFTRATGSGTASMDMVFTNAGTLNVNTGTLRVDTTLTGSGPVNVTGTLDLNAGTHNFNAGTTLSGTGTVILRATENFNAGASFTLPSVQLVSGVTTLATGSTIVFPNFTHAAGTLTGTDQVDVTSSYVWSGGLQEGGGITNANVPLTISSTVVLRNRTLNLNAGATATATLSHGLGAVINLPVGQTYSVQGDFVVFSYGQGGAAGVFNNAGVMQKSSGTGLATEDMIFVNSGTVRSNAGTLQFTNFTQTAGATLASGGAVAGSTALVFNGGSIQGVNPAGGSAFSGTINNAAGTAAPGPGTAPMGIIGNYIQGAGASYSAEIGGQLPTQYDRIAVSGTATLAGQLAVSLTGGFVPSGGEIFDVMTFAGRSGTFTSTVLPSLPAGLAWNVLHGATFVQLQVIGGTPAANLTLAITDTPDPVGLANQLTYAITVTNAGPNPATNTIVSDVLPASVNLVSATSSQGGCSGTSAVTCNLGTMASGANATVTIVVTTTQAGTVNNTASVSAMELDPLAADNSATATTAVSPATFFGPLAYTCQTDSPFLAGILGGSVLLETFEDGLLNTVGVAGVGGSVIGPGGLTDNVDCDDGVVDGSGSNGRSYFGGGIPGITFNFNAAALGGFPTQVGIVWTDGGGIITFEAFDALGVSLGTTSGNHSDGGSAGTTGEDRFYGVSHPGGISSIRIQNSSGGIEVDHLQYTAAGVVSLSVPGSVNFGTVAVGGSSSQVITVANNGTANVTVTGVGLTGGAFNLTNNGCAGVLLLTPGTNCTITITFAPLSAGVANGSLTITSTAPNSPQVVALTGTAITAAVDLQLTKGDSPDPFTLGAGNLTYTLTVGNAGSLPATSVVLSDTLPPSAAFVSSSTTQGSCSGTTTVTCNLGTIASAANATVIIVVTPTATGTLTNTASVTAAETEPNTANNAAVAITTVSALADISLTKADGPDPVTAGSGLTYTLTVSNAGPAAATNVTLSDPLPSGAAFASFTASQGSCSGTTTVVCTLGTINNGAGATVTIGVIPSGAGSLSNTATVAATETDPNLANNSAAATTTVTAVADLSITKTDTPDPVIAGNSLTYTIAVANAGPNPASGVVVTDTLPAGVTFISATATQGSCVGIATVTCNLGPIANGGGANVTIVVQPVAAGALVNNVSVTAASTDPNPGNNTAAANTTVTAQADLSLVKADSADPAVVNAPLTYTVTVTNLGPSAASGVVITDTLPGGVAFVSASPGCVLATGLVTCTVGNLARNVSAAITIVVTPPTVGNLSNTASVTSAVPDPNLGNDTATETTSIVSGPAIQLSTTSLAFASQPVGTTSPPQAISLNNQGNAPLLIASIATTGNFAQTNTCGASLAASGSCALIVTFTPSATGPFSGSLTITSNAPGSPHVISLTGSGAQAPFITLSSSSLVFSSQLLGSTSAAQSFTLTNSGSGVLALTSIVASGDFAQTNTCGASVTIGASCTISVTFTPTGSGLRTGAITITSNAPGSPPVVTLTGIGASPGVTLSTFSLSFGPQATGTTSPAQTVSLTNGGSSALTITSIVATGDFAQTNTCGTSVGAGATCIISVTFTPVFTGGRSGTLTITDGGVGSPRVVSLSGTGVAASLTVLPGSLTFAAQPAGTSSGAQAVTVTNTGGSSANITAIAVTTNFTQTNNCPATLAPAAACTVNVVFAPGGSGLLSGTLTITSGAAGSPHVVNLLGTGIASGPAVALAPAQLTFASLLVGSTSAVQNVTLSNTGNAALSLVAITAGGDFAQTNTCGAGIAAGATCVISVTFTPTTAGPRVGTLSVASNAASSPDVVALAGMGLPSGPAASLSVTTMTFSARPLGSTSPSQPMTLSNTGNATLTITSIAASGDFAQTNNCGASVNAGASCIINVTFTPTGTGARAGAVIITDNGPGSPRSVALVGTGTDFSFTISAGSATVNAGQAATFTLSLIPSGGFAESVQITCGGAPFAALCSVAPASFVLNATTTVTVTVTTTAPALLPPLPTAPGPRAPHVPPVWPFALLLLAMGIAALLQPRRRASWAAAGVLLIVVFGTACAGGAGAPPITQAAGTPQGGYTLTVTATSASGTTRTAPLSLIVR